MNESINDLPEAELDQRIKVLQDKYANNQLTAREAETLNKLKAAKRTISGAGRW